MTSIGIAGRALVNITTQEMETKQMSPTSTFCIAGICGAIFGIGLCGATLFGSSPLAAAGSVPIQMTDDQKFVPDTQQVKAGDTIVWSNTGKKLTHNVTPDPNQPDPFKASENVGPGGSYSVVISGSPRTIMYYCTIHGAPGGRGMSGKIVVGP